MEKIFVILNVSGKILYTLNAVESFLQVLRNWLYSEYSLADLDIIRSFQEIEEFEEKKDKKK